MHFKYNTLYIKVSIKHSGGSRGGARGPAPLILGEKRRNDFRRNPSWASKIEPGPLLSSKSGSATETDTK